ncbi:peptide chain release factor N(5)-glutamine methyltransferase [Pararhizobium mangrovi]|uniref:Release factor glutamine methyltransferase n=1 Tax=Pararhizobium mangrovi TaxID=2590452 RepID=A0A506U6E8_9HYPH|nr:peptide chain release factor N(5)-glutamine methyltransferase [Pararhizobium mangrovi]TPW28644.1 peptide chain release factor N(5)-glutamine methyltransferase [Pararhizobium mangrovi]
MSVLAALPETEAESVPLGRVLADLRRAFAHAGIAEPAADARVLVAGALGLEPARLILHEADPLDAIARARIGEAGARRLAGEPVYRILGIRSFFGLTLALSPETLEPRVDSEILVEAVMPHVARIAAAKGTCRIADLGTGTGALALALLAATPAATALGTDISIGALETASANAARNGLADRFRTVRSDWFDRVEGERFDLVVSNPPYIASSAIGGLLREVREHDPRAALDGGADGLDAYRRLAEGAAAHLEDGGAVAVEHGFDQPAVVAEIFARMGFSPVSVHHDLAGHRRAAIFVPRIGTCG